MEDVFFHLPWCNSEIMLLRSLRDMHEIALMATNLGTDKQDPLKARLVLQLVSFVLVLALVRFS